MSHDDPLDRGGAVLRCEAARERILEADPAQLRGEGGGALARHLAGCAGCRALARRALATAEVVDAALDARVAARARPVDEVLRQVRAELEPEGATAWPGGAGRIPASAVGRPDAPPDGASARGHGIRWKVLVPLAAAAFAASLVLWPRGPSGSPDGSPVRTAPPAGTALPVGTAPLAGTPPGAGVAGRPAIEATPSGADELQVAADRRFALMKTDDPGISVVWFY